jgi:MraZ protein
VTEFGRFTEALRAAPITDVKVRNYGRHLFASASNESPDGQGRITVPPHLRDYAGLEKDCVVIGANTRLEVWDAAAYQAWLEGTEQDYADVAEEVLPGIF